jgi:hypothetical protein
MMRSAYLLAFVYLAVGSAFADSPKIDRTIGKEPVYQTKSPKYGLLAFGPEGKDRVWLVLDGDTLYVDRNGDGDLTEHGKKVAVDKRPGSDPELEGYGFDVGQVTVGGHTHKALYITFRPFKSYPACSLVQRPEFQAILKKDPQAMAVRLRMDVEVPGMTGGGLGGRLNFIAGPADLAGIFQFADKPADAPIVRLGGPLQITFDGELPSLRVGRTTDLDLVVGAPGIGPGTFAMLSYGNTIPDAAKPVAELFLPSAIPGERPVGVKYELRSRC